MSNFEFAPSNFRDFQKESLPSVSQGRKWGSADAETKVPYAKENIQFCFCFVFTSFFQKSKANQNRVTQDGSLLEKRRGQNTVWNLLGYQLRKWLEKGCRKPVLRVCAKPSIPPVNGLAGYYMVVRSKTCEEGGGGHGLRGQCGPHTPNTAFRHLPEVCRKPLFGVCADPSVLPFSTVPHAHSEHRFPAPSSKFCQIWLRH